MGLVQLSWRISARVLFVFALAILFAFGTAVFADTAKAPVAGSSRALAMQTLRQEVFFERNDGQADGQVMYFSRGFGYSLFLTRDGAAIVLPGQFRGTTASKSAPPDYFRLKFRGANPHAQVSGVEELPGISNYFGGGDPKKWVTRVPHFAKVRYANLYPGIDVIFYSRDGQLEYDVVAAPGADLSAVRLEVGGAKPALTKEGDVAWSTGAGGFNLQKARVYQEGATAKSISASYALRGNDVVLRVGSYDRSRPIVVDPALIFSTYLTSNCFSGSGATKESCGSTVTDIAADTSGVYLTGSTNAPSFPMSNPVPQPVSSTADTQTFVVKLDPTGAHILYANYLSSSRGLAVAVDSTGSAYLSGTAFVPPASGVTAFPLTSGVFSGTVPANTIPSNVPYAAKFSADGSQLVYSTLLLQPGSGAIQQQVILGGIAVDSQGALYVAGVAAPNNLMIPTGFQPLPTTQGAFQTTPGGAFVMKLTPNASGLAYSTYVDGQNSDGGGYGGASGIAVDANGDAFITGSALPGFPTTSGVYQPTNLSGAQASNAFVMELDPAGSSLIYSTLFGATGTSGGAVGAGNTGGFDIAVDAQGEAVIVGQSSIPPVTPNAFCPAPPPVPFPISGFVAKFNATGTALVYATTLCGNSAEADSVAVDSTGAAYVTGSTTEPSTFQPVLTDPIESYLLTIGGVTANMQVALKLDTSGNLQWATLLAGIEEEVSGQARIAIDPSQNVYVMYPGAFGFPETPGSVGLAPPSPSTPGANILLKIAPSLGAPVPLTPPFGNPLTFAGENLGTSSASQDVPLGNFGDAPLAAPTISVTGDFSETDNCSSGVAAGAKCDVNVVFAPTATGTRNGTLVFNFGGGIASQTVALAGTGTAPAVTSSPTSLSFGDQANGTTSGAQQVTVTNGGTGSLTITSIQASAQFGETNTCGAPIAPMGACTIQVTFTPNASGAQTGTLTITDNAPGSPQTVALAGNQPANFTLAAGSGSSMSATVTPGQSASYSLSVSGSNGFSGAVNFSCSGAPASATCSVTPNPANVSGSGAVTVTVSVSTAAASMNAPGGFSWKGPGASGRFELVFLALAAFGGSVMLFGRRHKWAAGMALATAAAVLIFAGCGGGSSKPAGTAGTPAGQYTMTVTGTSGSITQSMNLTLMVN